MTRMMLYDRLRTELPVPCFLDEPIVDMPAALYGAHCFDITQVGTFFLDMRDHIRTVEARIVKENNEGRMVQMELEDLFGFQWRDFEHAPLYPPFMNMWFEYDSQNRAPMISTNMPGDTVASGRFGMHVSVLDMDDGTWGAFGKDEKRMDLVEMFNRQVRRLLAGAKDTRDFRQAVDDLGWIYIVHAFVEQPGLGVRGPTGRFAIPVRKDGGLYIVVDPTGRDKPVIDFQPPEYGGLDQEHEVYSFCVMMMAQILVPSLMALSMINTPSKDESYALRRETPSGPYARKFSRRYGTPLATYDVLDIGPMRQRLERDHGVASVRGLIRALHEVRGHPRRYTKTYFGSTVHPVNRRPLSEENPYTIFIPPHKRGNPEAGRRDHDYRVTVA